MNLRLHVNDWRRLQRDNLSRLVGADQDVRVSVSVHVLSGIERPAEGAQRAANRAGGDPLCVLPPHSVVAAQVDVDCAAAGLVRSTDHYVLDAVPAPLAHVQVQISGAGYGVAEARLGRVAAVEGVEAAKAVLQIEQRSFVKASMMRALN